MPRIWWLRDRPNKLLKYLLNLMGNIIYKYFYLIGRDGRLDPRCENL